MGVFRKIAKNLLPYCLVKKYQSRYDQSRYGGNPFDPGGYYSPIPSMENIKKYNFKINLPVIIPGIDLNTGEQMNLLNSFERYYKELPFTDEKTNGLRYYYRNSFYSYSDAIFL